MTAPINQDIEEILQNTEHEDNSCLKCDGFCCSCELCDCCSRININEAKAALTQRETDLLEYMAYMYGLPKAEVVKLGKEFRRKHEV